MTQPIGTFGRSRAVVRGLLRSMPIAVAGIALVGSTVAAAPDVHLLKNIRPAAGSSSPFWFTAMKKYVLFFANDGQHGMELWRTNGTGAATTLVKNIRPGSASGIPIDTEMISLGSRALFSATDGINGTELWRSDGTPNGTQMVRNIFAGSTSSSPHQFMRSGNRVFFVVTNGTHGDELWVTDGTHNGTKKASAIDPTGPVEIDSDDYVQFDGGLAFGVDDGHTGMEPWFSDGTPAGTAPIADISPSSGDSNPFDFSVVNGLLYFAATDPTHGQQLWNYDAGTPTLSMLSIHAGTDASVGGLARVGSTLYFQATDSKGAELWRADGSTVKRVKDINPNAGSSNPTEIIGINGTVYFHADDGTHGDELWKSDGTATHTVMVKDAYPQSGTADPDKGSDPAYLHNVGGLLMYEARDATHGYSLWRSDGTLNGTHMVRDLTPGPGNFAFDGDAVMGKHFFVLGDDGVHGEEMWQSDGTKNGTFILDINPGPTGSDIGWANTANGVFYIGADDGTHGNEPWVVTP